MTGGLQQVYRLRFFIWENCGNGCNVAAPGSGLWLLCFFLWLRNQWDGAEAQVRRSLIPPSSIKILTGRHYEVIDLRTGHVECHSKDGCRFLGICRYPNHTVVLQEEESGRRCIMRCHFGKWFYRKWHFLWEEIIARAKLGYNPREIINVDYCFVFIRQCLSLMITVGHRYFEWSEEKSIFYVKPHLCMRELLCILYRKNTILTSIF